MILLEYQPAPDRRYPPGQTYHVRVGNNQAMDRQARALWQFIHEAVMHPLALVLDPLAGPDVPPLADLTDACPTGQPCRHSTLTLFSSGTTGTPKPIKHDLAAVLQRKRGGQRDERWLLTYAVWRWAGLSVMLHVFKSQARLLVPDRLEPEDLLATALEGRATHLSLTPSLLRRWQLTCGSQALARLPLKQVTFGGEAATQPVLDLARRLWPKARISHVYASTEAGDVCAVSDGLAGIPAAKFTGERFAFTDQGELVIDGRPTGDLWELRRGRYHFLGRRQELINVGGAKVSPIEVESAALAIDGVYEARAFAMPSPLVGQVVALDYTGPADPAHVQYTLRRKLPKVAWPAQVNPVERIDLTDAAKTRRIEKGTDHA